MSKLIVNEIEKYDAGQLTITTGTNVSIGSNLTVDGTIAGTLSTAAQPNVTSVGTLSSLAVSGNLTIDSTTLTVDSVSNQVRIGDNSVGYGLFSVRNGQSWFQNINGDGIRIFNAERGASPSFMSLPTGAASIAAVGEGLALPLGIGTFGGADLILGTNNAERMRIDSSGNVGIGASDITSVGNYKVLELNGTAAQGGYLRLSTSGTEQAAIASNSLELSIIAVGAKRTTFFNNGAERMRIDSSGNVGIGTSSPGAKFEVSTSSADYRIQLTHISGQNLIKSIDSNHSTYRDLFYDAAQHIYRISGTERMRINSSGNVGIGTTSPLAPLEVRSPNRTIAQHGALQVNSNNSQAVNLGGSLSFGGGWQDTNITEFASISGRKENSTNGNYAGYLSFGTRPMGNLIAERMRITSEGRVLIGTSSPSVGAASFQTSSLHVNDEIVSMGSEAGLFFENRSGGVTSSDNWYGWYNSGDTTYFYAAPSNVATINSSDGTYTPISDRNKKKHFEYSNIGLNEVLQLKPTLYRMLDEDDSSQKSLGFIAQDVKDVIPQAYVESGDLENKFIGLSDRPILAAAIKAIQELKNIVDNQQLEIDNLKAQLNG